MEGLLIDTVKADVKKEDAIGFKKQKLDSVLSIYRKTPRTIIFAVEFVSFQARVKWVVSEKYFLTFSGLNNSFRKTSRGF